MPTNEEIESRVTGSRWLFEKLARDLGEPISPHLAGAFESNLRIAVLASVSQAYEEAAKKCDEITAEVVERTGLVGYGHLSGHQSAKAIRALKDSLVQEPVAST